MISRYKDIQIYTLMLRINRINRSFTTYIDKSVKHKLCIQCKHFMKDWSPYGEDLDHANYGKCKLFGELNLITGDNKYEYAKFVRNNQSQCGISGTLFEKRT